MIEADVDKEALAKLRGIIAQRSFSTAEEKTLASGRKSKIYFDMKRTMAHPEGASLAATVLFELISAEPEKVAFIGGLATGAISIATAVTMEARFRGRDLPNFWVREKPKEHGARARIEGQSEEALRNARVIVLDDVNTTGGSTLKAALTAREAGANVDKAITIVDRQEGAGEALAEHGITLVALFTISDFC